MADTTTTTTTSNTQVGAGTDTISPVSPSSPADRDRRMSDEWDASKVPPSRFQRRKGSIYAVPSSRDGHIDNNYAAEFHRLHAEKGYNKK